PAAAQELAGELLHDYPTEISLLLGFSAAAARMDNVCGPQGLEGALTALETALKEQGANAGLGLYFIGRTWVEVQRPDLARRELDRALRADPGHEPSRLLAVRLADAAEDWAAVVEYTMALESPGRGRTDLHAARARALAGLGRAEEAEST